MQFEKIAARLKASLSNEVQITQFSKGIELIESSGLLPLLKLMFRTKLQIHGEHPQEMMALQGAYNSGANDVLDTMIHFKEMYLESDRQVPQLVPTFGAFESSLRNGDLTKEESDAIKRGERPNYDKYIGTNKPPNPKPV